MRPEGVVPDCIQKVLLDLLHKFRPGYPEWSIGPFDGDLVFLIPFHRLTGNTPNNKYNAGDDKEHPQYISGGDGQATAQESTERPAEEPDEHLQKEPQQRHDENQQKDADEYFE